MTLLLKKRHWSLYIQDYRFFFLVPFSIALSFNCLCLYVIAFRMDSSHNPLAGRQNARENNAGHAEEARGLPRLPPQAQASQSPGKMSTGDQFQYLADKTEDQQ